jgi:hypothetical protein
MVSSPLRISQRALTVTLLTDQFRDIVSPSISQLLRTALLEGDENIGNIVEKVLFDNFTTSVAESEC